ncbi:unnamed protein product [Durusdinium trenchii]|uniref:ATP-dependent RNA helicase A (DEAH box protein 9) (DExH-box helicase 9) (Leukophysin) (LKP) (Nuclear DNA helicase II) (NDH II) (RNA helicase A) n=2 Tax=Durusdinium trenchii TaxID=1381693 RepID=A0ABP0QUC2_9DINO
MSVFEPLTLPAELKLEIRQLAEELELKVAADPGQEAPDLGSSEPLRLAPQVHIRSTYRSEAREKLRIQAVSPARSPWDERYAPSDLLDDPGREQVLQKEQSDREEWYNDRLSERDCLPIYEAKDRVLSAIRRSRVTLVAADTGSGKSTQVPQFILDEAISEGRGRDVHVVCTQPRRLAAVSLASRVSWERGERSDGHGSTGHVVRWEERPPRPWGSICFCTVGSLLPRLSRLGASHIIVDEAHTRDIHTDLLLTVLLELLRCSWDLKVIVMSATLDVSKWQGHFRHFDCELVRAGGRPYDVRRYFLEDIVEELRWQPSSVEEVAAGVWSDVDCNRGFLDPEGRYSQATLLALRSIPESLVPFQLISAVLKWVDGWRMPGGVLVFLPGWHEIATCMSRMQRDPALRGYEFVPLHSSVPPNEQYKAFHPASSGRKAILSTDIAETSITIPDIICVVDTGLARVKKHTNLEVVWASQANLLQRCGRAGRVQHGSCVHLFTRSRFGLLDPEPTPEMRRVPLDEAMLSVCDLGLDFCKAEDVSPQELEETGPCAYVMSFLKQAPDPPEPKDVRSAFRELQHVGALDRAGFLTHLGALLVRLPMSPGLGCAFYLASLLGFPEAASQVCAALDGREPFGRRPNEESGARRFAAGSDGEKRWSDVFAMAKALGDFEWACRQSSTYAGRFCRQFGLIQPVLQQLQSAQQQLKRVSWDLCRPFWNWNWNDAGDEGRDSLEDAWPILQTMLTFAYGWNMGKLESGRRVHAGWSKPARLAKTSVLVDEDPPCQFLTYVELTNSGGRMLRGGTMVTPQQLVFCGSRAGPFWQEDMVVLENWLEIEADFESAALLAALRSCNRLVLQKVAELSLHDMKGGWVEWTPERERLLEMIQKWKNCIIQVARLPLPEKISVWDMNIKSSTPPPCVLPLALVPLVPDEPDISTATVDPWSGSWGESESAEARVVQSSPAMHPPSSQSSQVPWAISSTSLQAGTTPQDQFAQPMQHIGVTNAATGSSWGDYARSSYKQEVTQVQSIAQAPSHQSWTAYTSFQAPALSATETSQLFVEMPKLASHQKPPQPMQQLPVAHGPSATQFSQPQWSNSTTDCAPARSSSDDYARSSYQQEVTQVQSVAQAPSHQSWTAYTSFQSLALSATETSQLFVEIPKLASHQQPPQPMQQLPVAHGPSATQFSQLQWSNSTTDCAPARASWDDYARDASKQESRSPQMTLPTSVPSISQHASCQQSWGDHISIQAPAVSAETSQPQQSCTVNSSSERQAFFRNEIHGHGLEWSASQSFREMPRVSHQSLSVDMAASSAESVRIPVERQHNASSWDERSN